MVVRDFYDYCESGQHTPKFKLLYHMFENLQTFQNATNLLQHSIRHKYINMLFKLACEETFPSRRNLMM